MIYPNCSTSRVSLLPSIDLPSAPFYSLRVKIPGYVFNTLVLGQRAHLKVETCISKVPIYIIFPVNYAGGLKNFYWPLQDLGPSCPSPPLLLNPAVPPMDTEHIPNLVLCLTFKNLCNEIWSSLTVVNSTFKCLASPRTFNLSPHHNATFKINTWDNCFFSPSFHTPFVQ